MRISIAYKLCCPSGHSPSVDGRECPLGVDQLLLIEGDRVVDADRRVLPLVAGRRIEPELERVAPGLAGLERAEAHGRGRRGGRRERHEAVHTVQQVGRVDHRVAVHAGIRRGHGRVAERLPDLHVRRDGPGVGDVDHVGHDTTGGDVVEVQVERADAAVVVAEPEAQRGGVNGDVAGVARREVRSRDRHQQCAEAECDETGSDDGTDDLLGTVGGAHEGPLSVATPRS